VKTQLKFLEMVSLFFEGHCVDDRLVTLKENDLKVDRKTLLEVLRLTQFLKKGKCSASSALP